MKLRTLALVLIVAAVAQPSLADDKTTGKEVGRKVEDAGKAIGSYTIAQRNEAIKVAQKALRDMDAQLNRMEKKARAEWDKMDVTARKDSRATMDALHKQRKETADWLTKLEKSSAETWDEVKGGFVRSYEDLRLALAKSTKGSQ